MRCRPSSCSCPARTATAGAQVDDPAWQDFATRHKLALVGCRFTDKPHEQSFIEEYVDVSQGERTGVPRRARRVRRALDSTRAGRRAAVAVGHVGRRRVQLRVRRLEAGARRSRSSSTRATSTTRRSCRGRRETFRESCSSGGKDLEFRTNTITGLFAVNRRAGALWALAEEPGAAHVVGRSRDVAIDLLRGCARDAVPGSIGREERVPRRLARPRRFSRPERRALRTIPPHGCRRCASPGPGRRSSPSRRSIDKWPAHRLR